MQVNAQQTIQTLATSAERLLILFDDILTADEIIRTSMAMRIRSQSLADARIFRITTTEATAR